VRRHPRGRGDARRGEPGLWRREPVWRVHLVDRSLALGDVGLRVTLTSVQGDPAIIELLNEVLTAELTSVNQYFLDYRMLDNWGFERLASHYRSESIDEMKDADALIARVLFLEGMPNLQRLGSLRIGEDVPEKLRATQTLEVEAIARLNRGIALCSEKGDNGTRELLEHILEGEESSLDWVETQLSAIETVGLQVYLGEQLHS
jgi:bacterioferritin